MKVRKKIKVIQKEGLEQIMLYKKISSLTFIIYLLLSLLAPSFVGAVTEEVSDILPKKNIVPHFLSYDVIIDVGHGGIDSGTYYGDIYEKKLNLEIGVKLYQELQNRGFKVGITRLKDYALSDDYWNKRLIKSRHSRDLQQRFMISEGLEPKAFISLHINSSTSKSAKGPVILYQNQAESYVLAQLLQAELNDLYASSNRSRIAKHLFLLEYIHQPALIAEVGFLSNPEERELLTDPDYQQKIATHMANAFDQFFLIYP